MGNLSFALRGLALLVLLLFAWQQSKAHRTACRVERDRALADSCIVHRGNRASCMDVASVLAERGIRSWAVKREGQRELVVSKTDATAARAALATA